TESMMDPLAKIVAGFPPVMPSFHGRITPAETATIIEFMKSLADGPVLRRDGGPPAPAEPSPGPPSTPDTTGGAPGGAPASGPGNLPGAARAPAHDPAPRSRSAGRRAAELPDRTDHDPVVAHDDGPHADRAHVPHRDHRVAPPRRDLRGRAPPRAPDGRAEH